jgi:serine/threonine protein kinase
MKKPFPNETVPAVRHMTEGELVRFALDADYEIIEELGRGGMAIVYRAREKTLDREVAIKVLPSRLVIDEGFVERFEHEARTAAKLEHPSIVPIYRVGRAGPNGDVIYFVMKLLRGQSLSSVLAERGKIDASDVRRILMETASALHYAAKQSVVHRDIKPDNIMLDSEGRCVITDFGIAKAPGGQQTTAGTSLGTPRYMSPEHAMGQPLDGRSDMYSLGIVAYQCLFGNAPFEADEPFAVLYKHIHEPLPEPTLDSDEARELYPIVARMLAKKPEDRFQTGNDLIAALGGAVSDPSLTAASISMLTSPGLMAPTERLPTPKPWSVDRWRMLSRGRQAVYGAMAVVVFASALSLAMKTAGAGEAPGSTPDSANGVTMAGGASAKPPTVGGATVSKMTAADSAAQAPKPKVPSTRAQFILDYNKNPGNCPQMPDTFPSTKPIAYELLVDSIPTRQWSEKMAVGYDVCGLRGTAFNVAFNLSKKANRIGRGGKDLRVPPEAQVARTPRQRMRAVFDMEKEGMQPGDYRLEVILSGVRGRQPITVTREFKILDKPL